MTTIPETNIDTKRVGHRVLYFLSDYDARDIIAKRRAVGNINRPGNDPKAGQYYPGVIVADFGYTDADFEKALANVRPRHLELVENGTWPEATDEWLEGQIAAAEQLLRDGRSSYAANLQVFLDGEDSFWPTSRTPFIAATQGYYVDAKGQKVLSSPDVAEAGGHEWKSDPEGHFIDLDA